MTEMLWQLLPAIVLLWQLTLAIRLPEFDNNFSIHGQVLVSHITESVQASSVFVCYLKCLDRGDCYSFNLLVNVHLCELSNATHLTNPEHLIPLHHGIYVGLVQPIPSCDHVACREDLTCAAMDDTFGCIKTCDAPIGVENGSIPNSQITASSYYDNIIGFAPWRGRLNNQPALPYDNFVDAGAWVAHERSSGTEYLQIDVGRSLHLTKIATQGRPYGFSSWSKSYTFAYGDDGQQWTDYAVQGQIKIFVGNTDRDTVVAHKLSRLVKTRFVRFIVLDWYFRIALRVELYTMQKCPGSA